MFQREWNCKELNKFSRFYSIFLNLLNFQAPPKKKILRDNNNPFKTKTLRKAIAIRSRLKNCFNKTRSDERWHPTKHWGTFVRIVKKDWKRLFFKRKPKHLSDNKYFWQTIKPYFSDKGNSLTNLLFQKKDCIVSNDRKLSEIAKTRFIGITKTLDLKPSIITTNKSVSKIAETFKDCPSTKKILSLRREKCQFKFHSANENEVTNVILNMDGKKADLTGDIFAGILKSCVDSYISVLNKILNTSLERGCLPNQLKLVTPVFKKEDELNKENYRSDVLSHA